MLTDELLKVIQADRAREIEAAARVRAARGPEPVERDVEVFFRADTAPRRRPAQTGTAATDPCV